MTTQPPTSEEAAAKIGEVQCGQCQGTGRRVGASLETRTNELGTLEYSMVAYDEPCAWCGETGRLTVPRIAMILKGRRARMARIKLALTIGAAARAWGMPTQTCEACKGKGAVGKRPGRLYRPCLACAEDGNVSPAYERFEAGLPLTEAEMPTLDGPISAPTPYQPNRATRRARG